MSAFIKVVNSSNGQSDVIINGTNIFIGSTNSNGKCPLEVKTTGINVDSDTVSTNIQVLNTANIGNVFISNSELSNIDTLYTDVITLNDNIITYDEVLNKIVFGTSSNLKTLESINNSGTLYKNLNLSDVENIQSTLQNLSLGSNNTVTFSNINVSGKVHTDLIQMSSNVCIKYDNLSNAILYGSLNNLKKLGDVPNMMTFPDNSIINSNIWNNIVGFFSASNLLTPAEPQVLRLYPPYPLTSANTTMSGKEYGNGIYSATSYPASVSGREPFRAFDHSSASAWQAINGNAGNWLKLKLPGGIKLSKIAYDWNANTLYDRQPSVIDIHGSQPGQTSLELITTIYKPTGSSKTIGIIEYVIDSPILYDTFTFTSVNSGVYCVIVEIKLYSYTNI